MRLPALALVLACAAACQRAAPAPTPAPANEWTTFTASGFTIRAVRADADLVPLVAGAIRDGERLATGFFAAEPLQPFTIAIYPDRSSLTEHWRAAWQAPSFQAPCWLIAAAWAAELDLLSPRVWGRDACGHDPGNQTHIRNVLAHEVVHVLHAQLGSHPNLASLLDVQWFFEGLAVYVSGMLDVDYAGAVAARLTAGFAPRTLAEVWNDPANYPLSGSVCTLPRSTLRPRRAPGFTRRALHRNDSGQTGHRRSRDALGLAQRSRDAGCRPPLTPVHVASARTWTACRQSCSSVRDGAARARSVLNSSQFPIRVPALPACAGHNSDSPSGVMR